MAVLRVILFGLVCSVAMPAYADAPSDGGAAERVKWRPFRPSAQQAAQNIKESSRSEVLIPRIESRSTNSESRSTTSESPSTSSEARSTKDTPARDKSRENVASAKLGAPLGATTSQAVPVLPPGTSLNSMYLDGQGQDPNYWIGPQPQGPGYCPPNQPTTCLWVRAEYLYWTTEGVDVPPLVTTGGTAILGQPGTTVLFGGNEINDEWRSGGRLHAGFWLDQYQETGIEGNVFTLLEETTLFGENGTAANPLGRPFFDIQIPGESVRLVPGPGLTTGAITIQSSTELQGAELMFRRMIGPACRIPTAILVGYRYARLDDSLRIDEQQTAPPVSISSFDSFDSTNTFHGAQIGLISEARYNRWTGEFVMKVAIGVNHAEVQINGATTTDLGVLPPVTTVGGLLAQASNIGTYDRDDFAVIPEFGATLGFNITDRLKATIGYTFIYWSQVARASEQIDRDINLPPIPGPNRPQFTFVMTDYWAHGANLGLEYAY